MKRVIFYAADGILTGPEQAALDKFNAAAQPAFDVLVMNAKAPAQATPVRAGDYRYGATPADYSALPVANPDSPPNLLAATQAVVANAQQLTVPVTGTYVTKATLTVVAGAVTAIALS